MTPFELYSRNEIWPGDRVENSNGTPRPLLGSNAPYLTVHYTGAGEWADFGDTKPEARAIQVYAEHAKKPWEYNWIIDTEGNVVEYAGFYRAAHSGGNNSVSHGVLMLLGVHEDMTAAMRLSLRQLRWWLTNSGHLAWDHQMLPHREMPNAATICPNERIMRHWDELVTPWTPDTNKPDEEEMPAPPVLWRDERYNDTYVVYPSVAPLDPKVADALRFMGAVDTVGKHRRMLKSLATMCGQQYVTKTGSNENVPVSSLPDRGD